MRLLPSLLLCACASAPVSGDGPAPMLEGDGFFDRPFPSAARTRADGTLDWDGFPADVPLLEQYLAGANTLAGAGTTAPIWVRFEAPIDPTRLPAPSLSTADTSPVLLVNVDPYSRWRGERVPVETEWLPEPAAYLPGNLLAVKPLHGWPLRPTTRYALVLREPLARAGTVDPRADSPEVQVAREALLRTGIDPDATAAIVPFTTQDPTAELDRMVRTIREDLGKVPLGGALAFVDEGMTYTAWEGHVVLPVWQAGDRPYRQAGGAFVFDEDGTPLVQRWERVRFTLAVPKTPMPAGGWPTALYSHGTGGDDRTLLGDGRPEGEATILCREGIAVIGVSQPLHGDRAPPGTNPELDSFNFLNIEAARHNFRQGALDVVYLAELLAMGPAFTTPDGEVRVDPSQVVFVGHSQGGLVGALAAPWMRDRVRAAVLSGAGGGLAYTVLLRKDPLDFAALVASAAGFADDEEITAGHPVVGLIQSLADVTDPINTAAGWFAEPLPGTLGPPLPVLLTEGLLDAYTPSVTAEALAAAARVPVVGAPVQVSEALRLRGDGPDALPARGNATAWDGTPVTAGLAQFAEDGHYAIYDNRRARTLYKRFATSALTGAPVIGE